MTFPRSGEAQVSTDGGDRFFLDAIVEALPDGLPTRVPVTARDRQRDCGPDEVSQVPTASFRA